MRRTAVGLLLLGLLGCSTAPIAGFLDLVAPGRICDGPIQPQGGVCVPHPVGGVVPPAGLPAITGEPPPPGAMPIAPVPTAIPPGAPPPPPLVPPGTGVPPPPGAVAVPPGTPPGIAPPPGFATPPPGGPAPPPPLTAPAGPPPAGSPPR